MHTDSARTRRRSDRRKGLDESPGASLPAPATPGVGARAAALEVLIGVLCEGHSLNHCLDARSPLPERRDNALVNEICYGVLRRLRPLQHVRDALLHRPLASKDGDVGVALLVGLYQLMYTRVSAHAAVATSAALGPHLGKARATALINAVLRSYLRRRRELSGSIARAERPERSHPRWLVSALRGAWPSRWREILVANDAHPPMTLRVNALRTRRAEYLERLRARGIGASATPHCDHGVTLARPVDVMDLPGFLAGEVSVQDTAAQLAAPLLDPSPGARVLDACAAPGGKSAHLLEVNPSICLTALDIDSRRVDRIEGTLARLGLAATLLCADAGAPARWWDGLPYQSILVDAPCTASGVIRRHPDLKWLRRPNDAARLAVRQLRLLASVWPLLARGGTLLYATCSILPTENDVVVTRFLADHRDAKPGAIDAAWGIATRHGRQTIPGEDGMDGFYYARLVKA